MKPLLQKINVLTGLILVASLMLVSGCALNSGRPGQFNSFLAGGCPAASISLVADQLAGSLAESYPPGHTSIYLKQTGVPLDNLGPAFEQALRSRGFTLVSEPSAKALTVTYVLDRLDDSTWYTRLTVMIRRRIKTRKPFSNGPTPASGFRLTPGKPGAGTS